LERKFAALDFVETKVLESEFENSHERFSTVDPFEVDWCDSIECIPEHDRLLS
jgi:hypothetical protein